MNKHELIAVLDGCAENATAPDDLTLIKKGRFTAVLTSQPRRRFILPKNRQQALQGAATRQAHLERCMHLGTVLPVRPNCLFDEATLDGLITANEGIFAKVSKRLHKAVQYQVTVSWQPAKVLHHFRDTPEIKPLFERHTIAAEDLQLAITKLAARLEVFMWQELREVVEELLSLPLAENTLLNCAVLLAEADTINLDQAVERIDAIWPDGFSIRQIGPAPGSSFALLDPIWKPAEQMREAHVTLGVAPGVCSDGLAEARRIALMQPDCDVGHIRAAAQMVQAATKLSKTDEGFYLCAVRSDDQSLNTTRRQAVA